MANVENFLCTLGLLHLGHFGFRRSEDDRNSSSNARPHTSHWNSYNGIPFAFLQPLLIVQLAVLFASRLTVKT
jgi:hypothetical protein